jgi:putative polyhydroxyalkanoate system protein
LLKENRMTKPLTVTLPHSLGAAEARRRIEQGMGDLLGKLGDGAALKQTWDGDRMDFSAGMMGQTISGWLNVLDDAVELHVLLPGILGMIASKVRGEVERRGRVLLEHKR